MWAASGSVEVLCETRRARSCRERGEGSRAAFDEFGAGAVLGILGCSVGMTKIEHIPFIDYNLSSIF